MMGADFTRTSTQVEREIIQLIDSVDRSLDSSSGESERKGQIVLTGFLSICVFAAIWGFQIFVASSSGNVQIPTTAEPDASVERLALNPRALKLVDNHLNRISDQADSVRAIKDRVAPSMPIDGSLDAIKNSANDAREILGIVPSGEEK
jgi:hypothetical protein